MIVLNFTTLTPLHISNGEQLGYGLDYIQKGEYIYKLNMSKIAQVFAEKKLVDFNRDYSFHDVINLIKRNENIIGDNESYYKVKASRRFLDHINNEKAIGRKYFVEFINSNGKFYIPASSVKGAILTLLRTDHLGIDCKNPNISDKFVIHDSDFIPPNNFQVYLTNNRPPKIGLLCLEPNTVFKMIITKYNGLNIDELKKNLKDYSPRQLKLALKTIQKYRTSKGKRPTGADIFFEALRNIENEINKLENDEYLINLGFGSGSYFKIYEGIVPYKFINSRKDPRTKKKVFTKEEAHTTFSFNFDGRIDHIGWCKLKIEEE